MSAVDLPAVVGAYFDAINAEDWEALEQVYHPEAVVHPPGGTPVAGSTEILAWYQAVFRRFPDHTDRPVRAIVSADRADAAVEIEFTGRTREGRSFRISAVDHFDIDGSQIRAMRSWLDTAAFAKATSPRTDEEM